jgi:hypothetical protein
MPDDERRDSDNIGTLRAKVWWLEKQAEQNNKDIAELLQEVRRYKEARDAAIGDIDSFVSDVKFGLHDESVQKANRLARFAITVSVLALFLALAR